jgi:hypothetical protein
MEFRSLRFNKAPSAQSFVTGTAKIINADVAAAGAVELQSERAVRATRQHAFAFTELEVLFGQTAFVAIVREYGHVSLIDKLCIY